MALTYDLVTLQNDPIALWGLGDEPATGGPAHAYWRLRIDGVVSGNNINLSEVQFREAVGVPQVPSGGTAFASSTQGASVAANAFDGDDGTDWQSKNNRVNNEWIGFEFDVPITVEQIAITSSTALGIINSPVNIIGEWSDDGIVYTPIGDVEGLTWAGPHPETKLSVSGTSMYESLQRISGGHYINEPTLGVDGQVNDSTAVLFDSASSQYGLVGDVLNFEHTQPFSISGLYKVLTGTTGGYILARMQGSAGWQLGWNLFLGNDGKLRLRLSSGTSASFAIAKVTTNTFFTNDVWYHAVATYSGNSLFTGIELYIDGVLITATGSEGVASLASTILNTGECCVGVPQ